MECVSLFGFIKIIRFDLEGINTLVVYDLNPLEILCSQQQKLFFFYLPYVLSKYILFLMELKSFERSRFPISRFPIKKKSKIAAP